MANHCGDYIYGFHCKFGLFTGFYNTQSGFVLWGKIRIYCILNSIQNSSWNLEKLLLNVVFLISIVLRAAIQFNGSNHCLSNVCDRWGKQKMNNDFITTKFCIWLTLWRTKKDLLIYFLIDQTTSDLIMLSFVFFSYERTKEFAWIAHFIELSFSLWNVHTEMFIRWYLSIEMPIRYLRFDSIFINSVDKMNCGLLNIIY